MSKVCSCPDFGVLIINGVPFCDTVVPYFVVWDIELCCPMAINEYSHLFTSGTYSTFQICNDAIPLGIMLCPMTAPWLSILRYSPSVISAWCACPSSMYWTKLLLSGVMWSVHPLSRALLHLFFAFPLPFLSTFLLFPSNLTLLGMIFPCPSQTLPPWPVILCAVVDSSTFFTFLAKVLDHWELIEGQATSI